MLPQYKQRRQTKRQPHPWSHQCFSAGEQKSVVTALMKNLSEPFRIETHFLEMQTYYFFLFFFFNTFFLQHRMHFLQQENATPANLLVGTKN